MAEVTKFVCDEHAQSHEAPLEFIIQVKDRETGKALGVYSIDACKEVHDWYRKNARTIETATKKSRSRTSRKRTARRKDSIVNPTPEIIRRWAASEGIEVNAKGRVRKDVRDAYASAH